MGGELMYKEYFYTEDLENTIEEIVFEELYKIINEKKVEFCQCNICIQDIAAIVLNKVNPRYKSNLFDKKNPSQYEKSDLEQTRRNIRKILRDGIEKVKSNPHH